MTRRRMILTAASLAIGLPLLGAVIAEAVLRLRLGLGDPPLFRTDPELEYVMLPGRYRRFGNTISINAMHMRGPEVAPSPAPGEQRLLIIGDSVIHGGNQTDDTQTVSALLQRSLTQAGTPATVLNVSCNSWGPGNQLAWVQRFGTLGAGRAVLVLNSWDYGDIRLHLPLSPETPATAPVPPFRALHEVLRNYGPRYAPAIFGKPWWGPGTLPFDEANPPETAGRQSLDELRQLVTLLRERGLVVAAVLHPFDRELAGPPETGRPHLERTLAELNVPTFKADDDLRAAIAAGQTPYRDAIHLTPQGNGVIALAGTKEKGVLPSEVGLEGKAWATVTAPEVLLTL